LAAYIFGDGIRAAVWCNQLAVADYADLEA